MSESITVERDYSIESLGFISNNSKARLFTLLTLQRYLNPQIGLLTVAGGYPLLMRYSVTVLQFGIDLSSFF